VSWTETGLSFAWRADLLDPATRAVVAPLERVTAVRVSANMNTSPRLTGSLDVVLTTPLEVTRYMVQVSVEVTRSTGETQWGGPVLTGWVQAGDSIILATGVATSLEILDPTVSLDDVVGEAYAVPSGSLVTTTVGAIVSAAVGVPPVTEDSSETTRAGMSWDPDATWRSICTDLLSSAGYAALTADARGRIHAAPYVLPAGRGIQAPDLGPGLARDGATVENRAPDVPNHLITVSSSDGETEPLIAERWDTDPASRWSVPSRGGRVVPRVETGVEATSQEALEAYADRLWALARSRGRSFRVEARWHPVELSERRRVILRDLVDTTATVEAYSWSADAGQPPSAVEIHLQEVVT